MVHSGGLITNEKHVWRGVYERSTIGLRQGLLKGDLSTTRASQIAADVRLRVSRRVWFMFGRDSLRFLHESGILNEFSLENIVAQMRSFQ